MATVDGVSAGGPRGEDTRRRSRIREEPADLGVPISTLQAISHPMANIAVVVQSGRNLARRAAWFLDHEPGERSELAASAFVFMTEEAAKAATMAVHVQGGLGVSVEAAASAYLVRAKGWPLAGGDISVAAKRIADIVVAREKRFDTTA